MRQPCHATRSPVELESLEPRVLLSVDPAQFAALQQDQWAQLAADAGFFQAPPNSGGISPIADPGPLPSHDQPPTIYIPRVSPSASIISDYDWWFGCGPTAAGMMLEWWEDNNKPALPDYEHVFPGDPNSWQFDQYDDANSFEIFSVPDFANGVVAGWRHFYDAQGGLTGSWAGHNPDSLADFMQSSTTVEEGWGAWESWVEFLDAWWGVQNYLAWDDPRTPGDEAWNSELIVDYVADYFWVDNPLDPADQSVPAAGSQFFPIVVGSDLLGRTVSMIRVQLYGVDEDVLSDLALSINRLGVTLPLSHLGNGLYSVDPGLLRGRNPEGTWTVTINNDGASNVNIPKIRLQVFDGLTYQKYMSWIAQGLPVILFLEGVIDPGELPPRGHDLQAGDQPPPVLGHYALGVGYWTDPSVPADEQEQFYQVYTTWHPDGGAVREWDWLGDQDPAPLSPPPGQPLTINELWVIDRNGNSAMRTDVDYYFEVKGAIAINTLTRPVRDPDNPADQRPRLTAYFSLATDDVSSLSIEMGLGDPANPDWSTQVSPTIQWRPDLANGRANYVEAGLDLEQSGALAYLLNHPDNEEQWYLKVNGSGWVSGRGLISDFQIRYYDQTWYTADRDTVMGLEVATVNSGIIGSIAGTVFDDLNGNGVRDTRTATATTGPLDPLPEPIVTVIDIDHPTPSYWKDVRLLGVTGTLIDVNVRLDITHPRPSDLTVKLARLGIDLLPVETIVLFSGVGGGADFTSMVLDDQAELTLRRGESPFTATFRPAEALSAFIGDDPESWWSLIIEDTVSGEVGTLNDFSVELTTTDEPGLPGWQLQRQDTMGNPVTVVTDAMGRYRFPGCLYEDYVITVSPASGWVRSTPNPTLGTLDGRDIFNLDYGYYVPVRVEGTVWDDEDGQGDFDEVAAGLAGVRVFLDEDFDGVLDWLDAGDVPNGFWDDGEGERWTVTDVDGRYLFIDARPGVYRLRAETYLPGWEWSYPAGGYHELTMVSGDDLDADYNLGTHVGELPDLADDGDESGGFAGSNPIGGTRIQPGESWSLQWRIDNIGPRDAGPFEVQVYASVDTDMTTPADNYLLAVVPVSGLAAGGWVDIDRQFSAFATIPVGDYYVGIVIDADGEIVETLETNNTALDDDHQLRVPGLAGLLWAEHDDDGLPDVNGTRDANDSLLSGCVVFLDLPEAGFPDGDRRLDWVDGNNNKVWDSGEGERWTVTDANGRYSFSNLANGTYRLVQVVAPGWVQTFPSDGNPATQDAHVVSFTAGQIVTRDFGTRPGVNLRNADDGQTFSGFSPGNVDAPGGSLSIWWDIRNDGAGTAGPFNVEFYAYKIENDVIQLDDPHLLGSTLVPGVAAFSDVNVTLALLGFPAIPVGFSLFAPFAVGIVIDPDNRVVEFEETDNTAVDDGVLSVRNRADLLESPAGNGTFSPSIVDAGDQWQVTWSIKNRGSRDAQNVHVDFYASDNPIITRWDTLLGSMIVTVPADRTVEVQLPLFNFPNLPAGTYYVGIIIDANDTIDETDENNNIGVSAGTFNVSGLRGTVYHDINGDKVQNQNEQGLAGWRVRLYTDGDGDGAIDPGDVLLRTTVADPLGMYSFTNLPAGHYIIQQDDLEGWHQTAPVSLTHAVTLGQRQTITGLDFGSVLPSLIRGTWWWDSNGDGAAGESRSYPMRTDHLIFLDLNGNGLWDWNGPEGQTQYNSHTAWWDGRYELRGVLPGTYTLRWSDDSVHIQTFPVDDELNPIGHTVGVTSGKLLGGTILSEGILFGFALPVTVSGIKWNDLNADGLKGPGEPPLQNWLVYLDADRDAQFDVGEQSAYTDTGGNYRITNVRPGRYCIWEIPQDGWLQSVPGPAAGDHYHFRTLSSGGSYTFNFGNYQVVSISGLKWLDLDADGVYKTDNEPGLNGWEIQLWEDVDGDRVLSGPDVFVASVETGDSLDVNTGLVTATGELGVYGFTNVSPGRYLLIEELDAHPGWMQSAPGPGFYAQQVGSGQTVTGLNFGNYQPVSISGFKWEDINGDGALQPTEPGVAGWVVFLDQDEDGALDQGETSTITDLDGAFSFTGLKPAATYIVAEESRQGWQQSFPASGSYSVTLQNGQSNSANFFGNWRYGTIRGGKFDDMDADHAWDWDDLDLDGARDDGEPALEPALAGWTIFLDGTGGGPLNGLLDWTDGDADGAWDAGEGERWTITDELGNYVFTDVGVGAYRVSEVQQAGWTRSYPNVPSGSHLVIMTSGADLARVDFGNYRPGTITGIKWHDVDGDGIGPTSGTFSVPSLDLPVAVPDADPRGILVPLTVSGLNDVILDVTVTLSLAHTYVEDLEIWLLAPDGLTSVKLFDGDGGDDGDNLIETVFDDQADTSINDEEAPFTGRFRPEQPLAGLAGLDPNGTWLLQIIDRGPENAGQLEQWSLTIRSGDDEQALPDWTIFLDANRDGARNWTDLNGNGTWDRWVDLNRNGLEDGGEFEGERWTVTDGQGIYTFADLAPGTQYTVAEILRTGWLQTAPVAGTYTITPDSGETLANVNFGNVRANTISGIKFEDSLADGDRDGNDLGLGGWLIALYFDSNGNGVLEGDELTTPVAQATTAAAGQIPAVPVGFYEFANLRPGRYRVQEFIQAGWVQTAPVDGEYDQGTFTYWVIGGAYEVSVDDGMPVEDFDFGNARTGQITGVKWEDLDADGVKDANERGVADWTIFIDQDHDGLFDSGPGGEPFCVTDANGVYVFAGLDPRQEYDIQEVLKDGWFQSYPDTDGQPMPAEGHQDVAVASGQTVTNVNFGNWRYGTISGTKFHDRDFDGIRDLGEEGLGGWVIFLDLDDDGAKDDDEPSQTTLVDNPATPGVNEAGTYSFIDLKPGPYTLVEQPQDGWAQTTPATGAYVVNVRSNQPTGSVDFGNVEANGGISGRIWNDLDRDGVGHLTSSFTPAAGAVPRAIPDDGTAVNIAVSVSGLSDIFNSLTRYNHIVDVNVTLGITHPNVSDLEIRLISPLGTEILLVNRAGGEGDNFVGTVLDDQAQVLIANATAPFTGSFIPSQLLAALRGENPNGVWTLRVTDVAGGNAGQVNGCSLTIRHREDEPGLAGWTAFIDADLDGERDPGERGAVTDDQGNYTISGLLPSTYRIAQAAPEGEEDRWTRTWPSAGYHTVSLQVDETETDKDFANKSQPKADQDEFEFSTPEDVPLNARVTANDIEGDPLTYAVVTAPRHGTLTLNADGTFIYVPLQNFNGADSFTFRASDARSQSLATTVNITVEPVNDPPVATGTTVVINEDSVATIILDGRDVETPAALLSFARGTGPAHGTLTLNGAVATYTPAANYFGPDSFTFIVTDLGDGGSGALSHTGTIQVTVLPVNDAPVADSQTLRDLVPAETGEVRVTLTGHDVETPDGLLTFEIETQPRYGVVSLQGNVATYVPAANYAGKEDSFTFSVRDADGLTGTGTIRLWLRPEEMELDMAAGQVVSYVDVDGTRVRVQLIGTAAHLEFSGFSLNLRQVGNVFTVTGSDVWIQLMALSGTNPGAAVTVTAYGGNAATEMGTLTGSARLSRFLGRGVDFVEQGIQMTGLGTIDVLQVRDLKNGADLILPGAVSGAPMSILGNRFGYDGDLTDVITDVSTDVILGRPVSTLTLAQFDDGSLTTPYVGSIRANGNRLGGLPGDFRADMTLTGVARPATKAGLGVGYFRGDAGGDWDIQGFVNSLTVVKDFENASVRISQPVDPRRYAVNVVNVLGSMNNVDFRTPGNVNYVLAKAMRDSTLFAGVAEGVTGLPEPETQILTGAQAAKINRVYIVGVPAFDPVSHRITFSYEDSNIAAYTVGTVMLRNADPLGEEPFGIAAWRATRLRYTDAYNTRDNWMWPALRGQASIPAGDFTVRLYMTGVESFMPGELITRDSTIDSLASGADISATYLRVLGDWVYIGIATARPMTTANVRAITRLDTNGGVGSLTDASDPRSDFQIEFNRLTGDVTVQTGVLNGGLLVLGEVPAPEATAVVTNAGVLVMVPVSAFSGYEFFQLTRGSLVSSTGTVLDRSPN